MVTKFANTVLLSLILFVWQANSFIAVHHSTRQTAVKKRSPVFSRLEATRNASSICTFDATDFAGTVGDWPYTAADMNRLDNSQDSGFYQEPRFVTHVDDDAIAALTEYYQQELEGQSSPAILDLCSSWISHLPTNMTYGRVVGIGMNKEELQANEQLTEFLVQDLNENPKLESLQDNSFDVVCNVVSVDYLTRPRQVFQEIHRVLRPGGVALMSFSNRCFPTKAVAMWLQADEIGRLTIVASYFHYTASWSSIEALDLKPKLETPERPSAAEAFRNPAVGLAWMNSAAAVAKFNQGDPMFVVKAVK